VDEKGEHLVRTEEGMYIQHFLTSIVVSYTTYFAINTNRAKFSATATIGVVHAMHNAEAMHLLQPYLPSDPTQGDGTVSTTGGYAEGGSLYALGLIHGSQAGSSAIKRQEATEFLRNHLRASHANEVISHGAALAVGLTAMGSADLTIVNELKELLDTDSAVAGEAAGLAIGMVLVGTGAGNMYNSIASDEMAVIVAELKNYARETQHEKIIRGLAMGLALMNYGQEENADTSIEEMRSDRDPVMRYGAMYSLALAYCGTGSNKAIRILLHTAVSDVSDDVRMAAVIGLAFVLYKTPERVPQLVKLLLESFNPHVRYGSCMAVGIAMAGTGDAESIALLEPMLEDMTDYVRQGALIGTAMIYMQQSDSCNGRKIRSFREKIMSLAGEKHQTTLTKMGAILAIGILDAGGRNCSLVLGSRNGFTKMSSAVGMALWLQHWHWFPMMHMFNLALTPTFTIGLNKDFKYPKSFEIQCNSKPSQFAFPKKLEEKKEEKKKRVETVTLSITAKENARLARKRAKAGGHDSAMEVDKEEKEGEHKDAEEEKVDSMDVDNTVEEEKPKKKREPEPKLFRVQNPSRITTAQALVCEFDLNQRYRPIRPEEKPYGVIILTDSQPGDAEELQTVKAPSLEPEGELAPPEPFEWQPPVPPTPSSVAESVATSDTDAA
jgi:26S proteasome regulatory subunit N2